jgi:hypothetical protein
MLFVARELHMVNGTPTATGRTRDVEATTLREAVIKLRASEPDPDYWRINASGTGMMNVTMVNAPVAWYITPNERNGTCCTCGCVVVAPKPSYALRLCPECWRAKSQAEIVSLSRAHDKNGHAACQKGN